MASIQNLNMSIAPGTGPTTPVMLSYTISFSPAEIAAGTVFNERAIMRGSDPLRDDTLGSPVINNLIPAVPGVLLRSFTVNIPTQDLNEDRDLKLLGLVLRNRDEVYARVSLIPLSGAPGTAARLDSDVVRGHFGP